MGKSSVKNDNYLTGGCKTTLNDAKRTLEVLHLRVPKINGVALVIRLCEIGDLERSRARQLQPMQLELKIGVRILLVVPPETDILLRLHLHHSSRLKLFVPAENIMIPLDPHLVGKSSGEPDTRRQLIP